MEAPTGRGKEKRAPNVDLHRQEELASNTAGATGADHVQLVAIAGGKDCSGVLGPSNRNQTKTTRRPSVRPRKPFPVTANGTPPLLNSLGIRLLGAEVIRLVDDPLASQAA